MDSYREEINKIDCALKELFIKRLSVAEKIAAYKEENNIPVLNTERENDVLSRAAAHEDKNISGQLEFLYRAVMDLSRLHQYECQSSSEQEPVFESIDFDSTAGCQGLAGAYSHQAAKTIFSEDKINFYETFHDVFEAVESGEVGFGVLPIENSNAGSVNENYYLLEQYNLYIAAEIILPVRHCLLIPQQASVSDITDVYSHEQSFLQCRSFFEQNPNLNRHVSVNNAIAAKYVGNRQNKNEAAIASKLCAELYNLKIARENIQSSDFNNTRFFLISKKLYVSRNANKISVAVKLPHIPGSLYRLLLKFAYFNLSLTKIESRPILGSDFEFLFFLDFEGNILAENVDTLIKSVKNETEYFKFFGNYRSIDNSN